MTKPVVCYATGEDNFFEIKKRESLLKASAKTKTSTFIVEYSGFSVEAQTAFQAAVDIWEQLIVSDVPIRIHAEWTSLGTGVLGSAIYTNAFANFEGAQKLNVFYPVAMAEAITGEELNDGEADIFARFSSSVNWHYDPNTTPPGGKYDLTSVVLHEIAHGLGFAGSFTWDGGTGVVGLLTGSGARIPIAYDVQLINGSNVNLIEGFSSPSTTLGTQLVSQSLFFKSATAGQNKIYAPAIFSGGSSISHLDEAAFNLTENSLMTPQIASAESMHDPGIALDMLEDLGWQATVIEHTALSNVESVTGPYQVVAKIRQSAAGYNANSVTLHYSLNGGTSFTPLTMLPTGNPDEFAVEIPTTNAPQEYSYFISVNDNKSREYANPGKLVLSNQAQRQLLFNFETGPDNKAPKITHTPKAFLLDTDDELIINARITDNIGIKSAMVTYSINDVPQGDLNLVLQSPEEDSIYSATISFGSPLQQSDVIKYTITVTDNSLAENVANAPATGEYIVNVVGLSPTQDSYQNDFDAASDDFFGEGFSIATPSGFANGAIHSDHPYKQGLGEVGDELELKYQLKIPIRVKSKEAIIKFDEIVLVEPGKSGVPFGDADFFDYVVVEGSLDGGTTWKPIADGYDSRANATWLAKFNSSLDADQNSTATGDPSLYRARSIDMLSEFDPGDEIVIRFRLHSDQLATGWGWAIDNLKIQIDETAPVVLNNHLDYIVQSTPQVAVTTRATDASGIKELKIEYFLNNNDVEVYDFDVSTIASEYSLPFGVGDLQVGDVLHYRIVATDSADLVGYYPPSGVFLDVPVIQFEEPVTTYANNFNSETSDFAGNFFSITKPTGFNDAAIHTIHNYNQGLGLLNTSDYTYTLKKPITISATNSYMRFDQIVLVEGHSGGTSFGTSAFKDYVIVEGSKDNGVTWKPFTNGYDIVGVTEWVSAFNAGSAPTPSLFKRKMIDMRASGDFVAGDDVLIRFRLFTNETVTGWGWAIDNLYIQDIITDAERNASDLVQLYPNPFSDILMIELGNQSSADVTIRSITGQVVYANRFEKSREIDASKFSPGLYVVSIKSGNSQIVRKLVKR